MESGREEDQGDVFLENDVSRVGGFDGSDGFRSELEISMCSFQIPNFETPEGDTKKEKLTGKNDEIKSDSGISVSDAASIKEALLR